MFSEKDTAHGANKVCVVQGSEHVAVNNKVAGSNPAANVFKNLKTT